MRTRFIVKNGFTAIGVLLTLLALQTTHRTFHPLPPGSGHVDGRGLFAGPLITALATCGGVLIATGVSQYLRRVQTTARYVGFAVIVGWAAVTPSVVYMTTFADSNLANEWAAYTDWYGMSLVVTLVLLTIGFGIRGIYRHLSGFVAD